MRPGERSGKRGEPSAERARAPQRAQLKRAERPTSVSAHEELDDEREEEAEEEDEEEDEEDEAEDGEEDDDNEDGEDEEVDDEAASDEEIDDPGLDTIDASSAPSDADEDGPGYAQYVDEDDLDEQASEPSGSEDESASSEAEEDHIRSQIQSVPFSNLVKAQKRMNRERKKQQAPEQDEDIELQARRDAARERLRNLDIKLPGPKSTQRASEKPAAPEPPPARESKNAPMVMSSRHPVSRKRTVVEPVRRENRQRDPRFDSLSAGPVNLDLHAKSYSFLPSLYNTELDKLREAHKQVKRLERNHAGPRAHSEQAQRIREESRRLELALDRATSQKNERERREQERALNSRIKKENQRRVDAGLRPYFPKKSERKEALLQQKFEQLSSGKDGKPGASAVRKAMDRKMRKDAQKEKRRLGSALGGGARTDLTAQEMRGELPKRLRESGRERPRKRGRRG